MSDMIISDVDEPKSDNLQDHKSNLVVSDHLSAEQESIIIPANYSSTIIPSTTSHESPTIDDVKTLQSPQIIPSEPTDIAHVSSPTSMDIMKSHYGQSIAEENLLNSQTPILASTETTGAEPQPALLSESVDTFQMTKLDDASEVLDDPPSRVVQGPRECRAVTTISLMEFPESFHYTTPDIQKVLLVHNHLKFLWYHLNVLMTSRALWLVAHLDMEVVRSVMTKLATQERMRKTAKVPGPTTRNKILQEENWPTLQVLKLVQRRQALALLLLLLPRIPSFLEALA